MTMIIQLGNLPTCIDLSRIESLRQPIFFWRQAVKQKGLKQTGILTRAGHSDFAHAFRFMAIDYRISKWNCIEKLNTVYSLSGCAIMRKN